MKQLRAFLLMVKHNGFIISLDWMQDIHNGTLYHYTFSKVDKQTKTAIFHVTENDGYHLYLNTGNDTFGQDIDLLNK